MNRGKQKHESMFFGSADAIAAFLGGGAADATIPTDGVLTDAAAGLFPRGANLGLTCVRSSAGIFVVTLSESVKNILHVVPIVVSDGASPTATLEATCTKITPPNTFTIKIFTPAGVLTDPGTSDLIICRVMVADTSAINGPGQ